MNGQNYSTVFGKDSTQWNYVTDYGGADFVATAVFKAFNDTLINNKSYKKLYEDYLSAYNLFGFLHEDSIQGKLWLKFPNDTTNYLLMNMSLNINDTFLLKNAQWDGWDENYVVKSVIDTNGKIIYLQGTINYEEISFIEGIGVDYIFHFVQAPWTYYDFLCSYKDNIITYDNPYQSECYIPFRVTGITEINESNIKIYPIPASGQLTIEFIQGCLRLNNFQIFDILGRKVFDRSINNSSLTIDISNFDSGLYYLRINNKLTKRIIINGY